MGDIMLLFPALSAIFAGLLPIFGKLSVQNSNNGAYFQRAAIREMSALAVASAALLAHFSTGCELFAQPKAIFFFGLSGFFEFAAWSAIFFSLSQISSSESAAIDKLTVPITLIVNAIMSAKIPKFPSLLSAILILIAFLLLSAPFSHSKCTLFAIFSAFSTSISLILSDHALDINPQPICGFFYRTLFSFAFALIALSISGAKTNVSRETNIYSALCGFCGGMSWLFCFVSLTIFSTPIAVASVKLGVFLTIPLSSIIFKYRPSKKAVIAYAILLAGLLLMFM